MVYMGKLRQFYAAFASGLGCLAIGLVYSWPSYTLALYSSNSTTPLSAPITKAEGALLGSLPSLGSILGTAVIGTIFDKFGCKNGGIIIILPFVFSWVIIAVTSSINVILAARFLAGIAVGGSNILSSVFVSEVAEDSIRGALASIGMILACMGGLISYLIGWFLKYEAIIWTNVAINVATIVFLMLLKESPVYLLKNGKEERALVSLAWYRGKSLSSKIVLDEIYRLKQHIYSEKELKSLIDSTDKEEGEIEKLNKIALEARSQNNNNALLSSFKMLLFSASPRRAFLVVITVLSLQVFMGMMSIQVYASTVFTEADPSRSELFTVLFPVVQCIGSIVSAATTDKTGRRHLQIGSSGLLAVCLAVLGYLLQYKVAPPLVTILFIMIYCFIFMVGPGSIPFILLSEVFVPQVINLATVIIMEWYCFINFVAIGVFPLIIDFLGVHGAFYGFSIMSLFNAIISYFILPETARLSREDIQKAFLPKRKK